LGVSWASETVVKPIANAPKQSNAHSGHGWEIVRSGQDAVSALLNLAPNPIARDYSIAVPGGKRSGAG
jgi:hypothetical protein